MSENEAKDANEFSEAWNEDKPKEKPAEDATEVAETGFSDAFKEATK